MDKAIFERYLEFRFQKASALTPGQKLDVVRQLLAEAHQGRVPSGERTVVSLPVEHPAVAAVLRGEEVSLGATAIRSQDWKDYTSWPVGLRMAVLVGIVAVFVLLAMAMNGRGRASAAATETPYYSPTPDWYATMTALAPVPETPTPLPPPPPPTATPVFLVGVGGPAENSRDPASIEIAGRLFMVSAGEVGDDGKWAPEGPQWLRGTEVRRVFAIPYESLADAQVQPGDPIYVRTRGGDVITYLVRDVVRLMANQIESFVSLRPSLVVALPMTGGDVQAAERVMLFGEVKEEEVAVVDVEETAQPGVGAANAYTLGGVNLRDNPGLQSRVLVGLRPQTPLVVMPVPPVTVDGYAWVYVFSPYGYGWVAREMVVILPQQ